MMTIKDALSALVPERQVLYSYIAGEFPRTMKALKVIDIEYTSVRQPKGYSLVKRDNKKLGFVYYVRYIHEGKMLGSKWCTHTNNLEEASLFAERNRTFLISAYLDKGGSGGSIFGFFRKFYHSRSTEYISECKRNGPLSEGRRKRYESVMTGKFIPFLKKRHISTFEAISSFVLDDFQDELLARGLKPQSVNDDLTAVKKAFTYLARKGRIRENPCRVLKPVPERQEDKKTHGCYELDNMKGVFSKPWKNKMSKLLNMIIYSTDMRNIEIKRFSKNDLIVIDGCHFIDVKESKTGNGIRLVPLHEAVYRKVKAYAKGMDDGKAIFGDISDYRFGKASRDLGKVLKLPEGYLTEHNITYYSGRHFWKTMMNAAGLGEDIEEVFMGHKVSGNVAKLYNHREARGKQHIAMKALEVLKILDKMLF